jgi:hypothetical protein
MTSDACASDPSALEQSSYSHSNRYEYLQHELFEPRLACVVQLSILDAFGLLYHLFLVCLLQSSGVCCGVEKEKEEKNNNKNKSKK